MLPYLQHCQLIILGSALRNKKDIATIKETTGFLADYLDLIASITPVCPEIGPPPLFSITTYYKSTRYVFKVGQHPEYLRERAKNLRKTGRSLVRVRRALETERPAPPISRAYVKTRAVSFIEDGEEGNAQAYLALFGRSSV